MLFAEGAAALLLAALILDALIGDPDWLWRRAPHPVVLMGRLISALDNRLNREAWTDRSRRGAGALAVLLLCLVAGAAGYALRVVALWLPMGAAVEIAAVAILLAQRSLWEHVARVHEAFEAGGLDGARAAVSMIVGRDPKSLDEAGVCRAAIETTAENLSDGVIAPAFWFLVAGLPGILIYKAVNTADSMIGHRNARHRAFGWAAARLDDGLNLIPARLSGFLIAMTAPPGRRAPAFATMWADAQKHRSPNAGWPEAAMAGALGLALAGPRRYAGYVADDAWLNAGGSKLAAPQDIRRALGIYRNACLLFGALVAGVALAVAI
jgi:adenosylcobinamide-phosphate synthase